MNDSENRRTSISRRALLRGSGVALALPWLEAMMTRSASSTEAAASDAAGQPRSDLPVRMAALFVPNGVHQEMWTPAGEGRDYTLSATLEPLEAWKDQLMVFTNLWNQASDFGDGHYVKTSGFLTCTTINKSLGIDLNCNGMSMDQVAAAASRGETPLPSLELGIDPVSSGVDTNVGYTRVYGSHIAWSGPTSPLAKELNPRLVFERLFRAVHPPKRGVNRDVQLLDRVLADANELKHRLGASDRRRMDEYLQSVRDIEQRLQNQQSSGAPWQARADITMDQAPLEGNPDDFPEHVRLMMDMIALAFQTDTTRVCTFMFGNAVSGRSFSFLDGVNGGHHDNSHHQNEEDKLRAYQRINHWHVSQYAYLLQRLRDMPEGEGNVLDHSMILYGSGLRDGNSHNPHNLPILLAGGGGGQLATGQHLSYSRDTPLANLYLAMLKAFGCDLDRFADSTGVLPGVIDG